MVQRFTQIAIIATALLLTACSGGQDSTASEDPADWRSQITTLRMGTQASEEDPIALRRVELVQAYISEATGLPVEMYQASDYNGIIQALASGQIHIAAMGAGSFANIHAQIGDTAEPFLVSRTASGLVGYYSTIVVRADSPYQSIEDLEGETLAYVDFNSTSGYIYPRWVMRQQGIDPDTFFGESAMAGGHIQAVMALSNGQFDATVVNATGGTPETGFATGTLKRLARRGMIDENDYRVIWHAGPIPNSPYVMRADMPQPLRDLIRGALASMPYDAPEAHRGMARLPGTDYSAVNQAVFDDIIEMRAEEIRAHRQRATQGQR